MSQGNLMENEVIVSRKKPISTYAAVSMAILSKHGNVVVKGVGTAIKRVVDVAEFIKQKLGDVVVEYSSSTVEDSNGKRKSLLVATIKRSQS